MYDEKPQNKFLALISFFLSEYLVWLVVIFVAIAWIVYPDLMDKYGQVALFLAPAIILIFGLIIVFTKTKIRTIRDEERGVTQYDITITKLTFYLVDFLIYGGSLLILFIPIILKNAVDVIDLLQALIFVMMGKWLKQSFYNKINR